MLRARLRRFRKRLQSLQYSASPEAVHEFRIVSRELLACAPVLQVLGPTRFWRKHLRKAIKAINQLRDLQQLQERLSADQLSIFSLEKKADSALRHWQYYQPELHGKHFAMALQDTEKRVGKSRIEERSLLLHAWHSEWCSALAKVQKRLAVADAGHLKTLHRLRIRYKSFRYLLELLMEAGLPMDIDASALRYWQVMLGEVEDFRVMAKLARKLDASKEMHDQFARTASEKALIFMKQKEEFSHFLSAVDRQVMSSFSWLELQ